MGVGRYFDRLTGRQFTKFLVGIVVLSTLGVVLGANLPAAKIVLLAAFVGTLLGIANPMG